MNNFKYKVGDLVKCVQTHETYPIELDEIYEVTRGTYDSGFGIPTIAVKVSFAGGSQYMNINVKHFVPYKNVDLFIPKFKAGDVLECVEDNGNSPRPVGHFLSVGNTYLINLPSFWEEGEEKVVFKLGKRDVSFPVTYFEKYTKEKAELPETRTMNSQYPKDLIDQLKGKQIICVTGQSRAGKDTFVDKLQKITGLGHYRYGDTMKNIAYNLFENFPMAIDEVGWSSEARKEKRFNGLNIVEVLIQAVDPLRKADPYVFIRSQLSQMVEDNYDMIVVSGCRTDLGLKVMEDLGATFIRIKKQGLEQADGATMDDVQLNWPVHYEVNNDGTLSDLKAAARFIYNDINKVEINHHQVTRTNER